MKLISPENLRKVRKKIGLSSQQAADSVYKNRRLWQRYEAPTSAASSLNIPAATLELFCLKHGLPFPPNKMGKLSKLISFCFGQGGAGHTSLTIDICAMLFQDGFDVLIVTGEHGASIYREFSIENNLPFPRVMVFDERELQARDAEGTPTLINRLNSMREKYDFIFLDFGNYICKPYFKALVPDLIIGVANMSDTSHRSTQAMKNLTRYKLEQIENKDLKTLTAMLMVGVPTTYTFEPSYYGFKHEGGEKYFENEAAFQKKKQSDLFKHFNGLKECDIKLMNAYTSNAYDAYIGPIEQKGFSMLHHAPNSLPAHELHSVKNEILRLLNIPE